MNNWQLHGHQFVASNGDAQSFTGPPAFLVRPCRSRQQPYPLRSCSTSRASSGNSPLCFFDQTSVPSTTTSKTPPLDSISLTSASVASLILAARLAARSR